MVYGLRCVKCKKEIGYSNYDRCKSEDEDSICSATKDLDIDDWDIFIEMLELFEFKCLTCATQVMNDERQKNVIIPKLVPLDREEYESNIKKQIEL